MWLFLLLFLMTWSMKQQVFVVQLQLNSSMNPGSIDLSTGQARLCRIIDEDSKWNNVIVNPF